MLIRPKWIRNEPAKQPSIVSEQHSDPEPGTPAPEDEKGGDTRPFVAKLAYQCQQRVGKWLRAYRDEDDETTPNKE